jgi:hypothetical protein
VAEPRLFIQALQASDQKEEVSNHEKISQLVFGSSGFYNTVPGGRGKREQFG